MSMSAPDIDRSTTPPAGPRLYLCSSAIERDAAFPDGVPEGVLCEITGVGLIDAAIGTARHCERHRPSEVIFLGTCGAHRASGVGVGDIVVASEVAIGSGDVVAGTMRLPSLLVARLAADPGLSGELLETFVGSGSSARMATVSCTLGITESDALADALRAHDLSDVENLEAFPVLRAAGDIPTAVILGVTNIVGEGGGAGWRANFRGMMRRVARVASDENNRR
jgi:nucleoside phosphorylase